MNESNVSVMFDTSLVEVMKESMLQRGMSGAIVKV